MSCAMESTVRRYVRWYEAGAELGGERQKLQVFCIRSMASGAGFA